MKKVSLVLASMVFLLGGKAHAQEMPFGFGIKAGYIVGSLSGLSDSKGTWNGESQSDLNILAPKFLTGLFVEYAFHDYVGAGLELGYSMIGGSFSKKQVSGATATDPKTLAVRIHQINSLPMLKIYPMGRDIDATIFSIKLGPELSMPLMASYKEDQKADSNDIDKKYLNYLNLAVAGGFGIEFPFGLLLDTNFSYGFTSTFKNPTTAATPATAGTGKDFMKDVLNPKDDKVNYTSWYGSLSIGYNFARLLD